MGKLTEPGLDALVVGGCRACGGKKLQFRAFLDGRVPLLGGDPVGAIRWVYDGEKFVDGVYEVRCVACDAVAFSADGCPRCDADGKLALALASTNTWPVPATCARCDLDEVGYVALIPATVVYDGKKADKPKTMTGLFDPGFHGMAVVCADCGPVAELTDACPLCAAPGPLRPRP